MSKVAVLGGTGECGKVRVVGNLGVKLLVFESTGGGELFLE